MRSWVLVPSAALLLLASAVVVQAAPIVALLAGIGLAPNTFLFLGPVQLVALPLGAWVAGIAFDRGAVWPALGGGVLLKVLGLALVLAAADPVPFVAGGAALAAAFGMLATISFASVAAGTSFVGRVAGIALLVVVLLVAQAIVSILVTGVAASILSAAIVVVAAIGVALSSPRSIGATPEGGAGGAAAVLYVLGVVAIAVGLEPSRMAASLLVVPINDVSIGAIGLFRLVVAVVGAGLLLIAGRIFFRAPVGDRAAATGVAAVGIAGLVSGMSVIATFTRAIRDMDFGNYVMIGVAGTLVGIALMAVLSLVRPRLVFPVRAGAALLGIGAAAVLVDLFVTPLPAPVAAGSIALVGIGAGALGLHGRLLVADTRGLSLGRVTAAAVAVAHLGEHVGGWMGSVLAGVGPDLDLAPVGVVLDLALPIAAIAAVILVGLLLPPRGEVAPGDVPA